MIKYLDFKGAHISTRPAAIEASTLEHLRSSAHINSHARFASKTLPASLLPSLGDFAGVYEILGLKLQNVLLSREKALSKIPLKLGDDIEIETKIADIYEQQGSASPMGFIVVDIIGRKGKRIVFEAQRILAIRGGFRRSQA